MGLHVKHGLSGRDVLQSERVVERAFTSSWLTDDGDSSGPMLGGNLHLIKRVVRNRAEN
jgi:hypothetical protein